MTDTQLAEQILGTLVKREWPSLKGVIKFKVKLRHSRPIKGDTFFHARGRPHSHVTVEFYLSPWNATGAPERRFLFAGNEACRAANEIHRGYTHAIQVGEKS